MNLFGKLVLGFSTWQIGAISYANLAHVAPEGIYSGMASAPEFVYVAFMLAYLVGTPVIFILWILNPRERL